MIKKLFALAAAISLFASAAQATEWVPLGARAMAMGGSGVALAQGPLNSYWNPAGLAQDENPSGLAVPVGAQAGVNGTVLQGANDVHNIYNACLAANLTECTQANIQNALNELGAPGSGAFLDAGAGANLKIGSLVVFVNELAYGGVNPYVDETHTQTNPAQPSTYVGNNQSALLASGLGATEIGIGYGHQLFVPGLYVGANLKGIIGTTEFEDISVINTGGSFNLSNAASASSFQPSIDLGALWDMDKSFSFLPFRPRVGMTVHDINDPKFTQPAAATAAGVPVAEPGHLSLESGARVGVALSPLHFWNLVADADLTRNVTLVNGYDSQMIGAGTEVNVFNRSWLNIPIRAGIERNVAQPGSKTILTAGAGLNFLHIIVDAGAEVTPSEETVQSQGQSQKIPSEIGGMVQLSILFGGQEHKS